MWPIPELEGQQELELQEETAGPRSHNFLIISALALVKAYLIKMTDGKESQSEMQAHGIEMRGRKDTKNESVKNGVKRDGIERGQGVEKWASPRTAGGEDVATNILRQSNHTPQQLRDSMVPRTWGFCDLDVTLQKSAEMGRGI